MAGRNPDGEDLIEKNTAVFARQQSRLSRPHREIDSLELTQWKKAPTCSSRKAKCGPAAGERTFTRPSAIEIFRRRKTRPGQIIDYHFQRNALRSGALA